MMAGSRSPNVFGTWGTPHPATAVPRVSTPGFEDAACASSMTQLASRNGKAENGTVPFGRYDAGSQPAKRHAD